MKNNFLKKGLIALAIITFFLVILLVVGPFLIPITPLEGLASPAQIALSNSKFITTLSGNRWYRYSLSRRRDCLK